MRHQVPLLTKSGWPMNDADWVATWSVLWAVMGDGRKGRSRWQRPAEWAAMAGATPNGVGRLLYAGVGHGLLRVRKRAPRGSERAVNFFARTDVVSANERLSDKEFRAVASAWRWEYDLVELVRAGRVLTPPPVAADATTRGEAELLDVFHLVGDEGRARKRDVWAVAKDSGQAKATFYACWDRLATRGVLRADGLVFWRYVPAGERAEEAS